MLLPRHATLFHVPSGIEVDASIVVLTDSLVRRAMGTVWWDDPALDPSLSAREIDRYWNWIELEIERDGRVLAAERLAVVTSDGNVQGAMLVSTVPVPCERRGQRNRPALFVELLFAAPRSRSWIRLDRLEQFRGVGLHLLRAAAEMSLEAGFDGRLKLESSPNSVDWYRKRGLLAVSSERIIFEGIEYTPMELIADRVPMLFPER